MPLYEYRNRGYEHWGYMLAHFKYIESHESDPRGRYKGLYTINLFYILTMVSLNSPSGGIHFKLYNNSVIYEELRRCFVTGWRYKYIKYIFHLINI